MIQVHTVMAFLLSEYVIGMHIIPQWKLSPYWVKWEKIHGRFVFHAVLIGHANWEPLGLPKPTQVVNVKHNQRPIRNRSRNEDLAVSTHKLRV